jgi:UDP-N-acetylmuramyl tripeptide synthase
VSQRWGLGAGAIIGGRVTLALAPSALSRLADGRQVVLVSGTNGKTTTSHLLAAALRTAGPVAHNASGANMADGAVAALAADPCAARAVLEVDELYLPAVASAVAPEVVVLLNLSRDQLDRGSEVRAVAGALRTALAAHPRTTVVANADDPMVVWASRRAARTVWVSTSSGWRGDASSCPQCGRRLRRGDATAGDRHWWCDCGLARPAPHWTLSGHTALVAAGMALPVSTALPGQVNRANAATAMAAADLLGVDPARSARAMAAVREIVGRYAVMSYRGWRLRLLLAKNPAGWAETFGVLDPGRPLLVVINAREADGRDTSWLWDVEFEQLAGVPVAAAGERAPDLGVRLSYAEIRHTTCRDPLEALMQLPLGPVDVVANYTAFHQLRRRLSISTSNSASDPTRRAVR